MKIEFVAVPVTLDAAAGEDSPRTITGVAVPWDTPAVVSGGQKVQFSKGAFDVNQKAPKLLEGHDMNQLRGVVTEMVEAEVPANTNDPPVTVTFPVTLAAPPAGA